MTVIEVGNKEVKCGYCKSLLMLEPYDVLTEPSNSGRYFCNTYFICKVCGAKNYSVPDDFKHGAKEAYERRMLRYL